MFKKYKKKTIELLKLIPVFFKRYLSEIVFLVFTLQLLIAMGTLPYFNIIGKYYFYVAGALWILANFLFKIHITNRRILIAGFIMFVLAIIPAIFQLNYISDIFGFGAYLFLITYILKQIFIERDKLI